ncbi:hypothetical protein [Solitalea lacus]|uniref:hypothetical protein n=1 Tax=Solitalea lacus TaxID=2911172 RepID=UPI001EDA2D40|nr:hypothetical protein [Solitalea lacus]UKJ05806.1 hypothetical protein L2B55_09620 [Solitalea lacus]
MVIKTTLLLGLTLLLSCEQQTNKSETVLTKTKSEKNLIAETANLDSTISPYQQEVNKALADPTIDNYYKEIYRQEKLIIRDDNKMLSITKNLFTKDNNKDLFYFIVFTKSMNGSDGFYSEAVGLSAFEFVTNYTEQFADYFNVAPKLTDHDMDNWANYIYGEIQISREKQENQAIKELENQLLENVKLSRPEYKVVIERFIKKIQARN